MTRPNSGVFERLARRAAIKDPSEHSEIKEVFSCETLGQVPVASRSDVFAAFAAARRAQRAWSAMPVRSRAQILERLADLVFAKRGEILDVIQAETGKSRSSALEEVLDVMITARFYAAKGPRWLADERVAGMVPCLTSTTVNYRPKGVVGIISPWNYPLTLAISDALPAFLAGNAVVCKPDSQTPFSALFAAELLESAGLPADLFQIVPGPGEVVGQAIVDECDYLMFTGSSATGRKLGAKAGGRLLDYSAELGGKNAMIVGVGADLEKVAEIATRAMFSNAGQLCVSIERVYVEEPIADQFIRTLARRVRAMTIASGYRYGIDMGSLISEKQLQVVKNHVADAVSKGARVICGGKARPDIGPYFFEPTVLADVPESAICFTEETFGPVVSVYAVSDLNEAVARANDTPYGLNSSVFCEKPRQGKAVARRLHTGTVNVNEGYAPSWGSLGGPMGGMGLSGVGRRHGRIGIMKYTEAQTVAVQRFVHLGGPKRISQEKWPELLAKATNLLKYLPGR